MQQYVISEGREEEEEEEEEEKKRKRAIRRDSELPGKRFMCGRVILYLKDRGDGRGPYVRWFGEEGTFVLGQQGRIIPH